MDIYRLYYNKFTAELPRVDTKFQIGMIMNERWQYCPHISWARSAVGFNLGDISSVASIEVFIVVRQKSQSLFLDCHE